MTMTATHSLPMILAEAEVVAVRRLSPTYVRVELGAPELADFGVDGPLYDQRIKLVFPNDAGELPSFAGADESWYTTWMQVPASERGHMRTYTVRDVLGTGADTRLVVDFVLHVEDGAQGPGSSWASSARPGDRIVLTAPRRGEYYGGIEFAPGDARLLLMAADETAVPAVCSILEDLPSGAVGTAFLEVPDAGDVQDVDHPVGVEVVWLPRGTRRSARCCTPRSVSTWAPARRRWSSPRRSTLTCGRPRPTPRRARTSRPRPPTGTASTGSTPGSPGSPAW